MRGLRKLLKDKLFDIIIITLACVVVIHISGCGAFENASADTSGPVTAAAGTTGGVETAVTAENMAPMSADGSDVDGVDVMGEGAGEGYYTVEESAETGPADDGSKGGSGTGASDADGSGAGASGVYAALQGAAALRGMFSVPAEVIPDYYGIFPEDYSDAVFMMSEDSLLADEYVIVRAADDAASKRIYECLKKRLQDKADEAITYSPEQYAIIKDGFLSMDGLWVAMLVSPEVGKLTTAYADAIK